MCHVLGSRKQWLTRLRLTELEVQIQHRVQVYKAILRPQDELLSQEQRQKGLKAEQNRRHLWVCVEIQRINTYHITCHGARLNQLVSFSGVNDVLHRYIRFLS